MTWPARGMTSFPIPSPAITAIRLVALTFATLAQPRTIDKRMMERRSPHLAGRAGAPVSPPSPSPSGTIPALRRFARWNHLLLVRVKPRPCPVELRPFAIITGRTYDFDDTFWGKPK